MSLFASIALFFLRILWVLLLVRIVVEMIRSFGRSWTPNRGVGTVLEIVFKATDWCLVPLRKLIRPVGVGSVAIDVTPLIVFFLVGILITLCYKLGAVPITIGTLFMI